MSSRLSASWELSGTEHMSVLCVELGRPMWKVSSWNICCSITLCNVLQDFGYLIWVLMNGLSCRRQFLPLEVGALCNHKTCIWAVCPTWCVWTCIIFLLLNVDLLPYKCRRQRGHAALAHALAHYTICCCKEGMLLKFIIHYTGYKDAHCPGALDNNYAGYKEDMLS